MCWKGWESSGLKHLRTTGICLYFIVIRLEERKLRREDREEWDSDPYSLTLWPASLQLVGWWAGNPPGPLWSVSGGSGWRVGWSCLLPTSPPPLVPLQVVTAALDRECAVPCPALLCLGDGSSQIARGELQHQGIGWACSVRLQNQRLDSLFASLGLTY